MKHNLINKNHILLNRKFKCIAIGLALLSVILCAAASCRQHNEWERLGFNEIMSVDETETPIEKDILSNPEMMFVNDSLMVIHDLHHNKLFSTINLNKGNIVSRFGEIGRGDREILVGSVGYLHGNDFIVFNPGNKASVKYDIIAGDSTFTKLSIVIPDNVDVSRLYAQNDSTAFIMGSIRNKFKYALCEANNGVIDSLVLSSVWNKPGLNKNHIFLAEQGEITISPDGSKIAATTNYSDNIDFIRISNKDIEDIAQLHKRDAVLESVVFGDNLSRMVPSESEPTGFLRLTSNDKYVFALYSDDLVKDADYGSKYILCYDWEGHPLKVLELSKRAYSLAANSNSIFLTTIDDDGLYCIKKIDLTHSIL